MCEFTVLLDDKVVATKVIKAKKKGEVLIMADTTGNVTRIEGVSIQNVDTIMTELILVMD